MTKTVFIKLFLGLLLFFGCKTQKQEKRQVNHLPIREDGFYYRKDNDYSSQEYLLLKFYKNGIISELSPSESILTSDSKAQEFACILDGLSKDPTIFYEIKGDSVFFKKKAWNSYEFANLYFSCKIYSDSIVAQITPIDYFDTLAYKPTNQRTFTYKFKQAICDTGYNKK